MPVVLEVAILVVNLTIFYKNYNYYFYIVFSIRIELLSL